MVARYDGLRPTYAAPARLFATLNTPRHFLLRYTCATVKPYHGHDFVLVTARFCDVCREKDVSIEIQGF